MTHALSWSRGTIGSWGLIPPRSGLWMESQTHPDLLIETFAEQRIVFCRDQDLLSLVFARSC